MTIWLRGLLIGITLSANMCLAIEHSISVGVSGGKVYYRDPLATTIVNLNNPLVTNRTVLTEAADSNLIWGMLAGYQVACLGWFAGVEFDIDWYQLKKSQNLRFSDAAEVHSWLGYVEFERKPVVALVARLGYKIAPYFLPYMRAGVETGQDKLSATFTSARADIVPRTLNVENKERSYRFIAGLGADFPLPIMTCPALRLEYNYHGKGRTVEAMGTLNDNTDVFPTFVSSTKPKMQTGTASIVWNLGNRKTIK